MFKDRFTEKINAEVTVSLNAYCSILCRPLSVVFISRALVLFFWQPKSLWFRACFSSFCTFKKTIQILMSWFFSLQRFNWELRYKIMFTVNQRNFHHTNEPSARFPKLQNWSNWKFSFLTNYVPFHPEFGFLLGALVTLVQGLWSVRKRRKNEKG